MRILLAGNPASGAGRGLQSMRRAEALLRTRGAEVTSFATEGPGHARRSIVSLVTDCRAERVVACGGDGLVSEVAAALLGSDVALALVPSGRGNDLARALRIPLDPAAACDLAVRGAISRMDAGLANGRPFVTVAACGLDAEISRGARASKLPLPGPLVYVAEILRRVVNPPRSRVRIVVDGRVVEDDAMVLAIANTATYGGGFRIAPSADPADGLLDACLIRSTSLPRTLALLPRVRPGRHASLPEVTMLRGSRIEVSADPSLAIEGDGEPLAATPCVFECAKGALSVVAGASRALTSP